MSVKERIIEVSSSLFIMHGIRALTMGEIAKALGISKRTIYEHFETKEQLLEGCLDYWEMENKRIEKEIHDSSANPVEVVHKHFRHAVMFLANIHGSFFTDLKKHHSRLWRNRYKCMEHQKLSNITEFFESGVKDGYFRKDSKHEIAAKLFFAQVDVLHDNNVFPPDQFSKTDVFREIIVVFLRGICTEKGMKETERLFNNQNF
ncbi:MAG TPA: TetR/AcrR family transcriptional regulator [Bacteroidales bacterium]|nr:TetR/AcrR family transcriptional regulator [Bacteroidales bacterium]